MRDELSVETPGNEDLTIKDCIKIGDTLVMTDFTKKQLVICNVDSGEIRHSPLTFRPWYIAQVDSNSVAVACTPDRIILIIDINTGSVTSSILTSDFCAGISFNYPNLYVVIGGSVLQTMDLAGDVIRTVPLYSVTICDIIVDRNRVVYTDLLSLTCCSLDGNILWKFECNKYKALLRVTADDERHVYVTDEDSDTVLVFDDGSYYKEILTETDRLYRPRGIYFDKQENVLLVSNYYGGKAFLFDVKKKEK